MNPMKSTQQLQPKIPRPEHDYVTLAKVLKPVQVKVHGEFHWGDPMGVQKRMDHAASLAWLFRFDGK